MRTGRHRAATAAEDIERRVLSDYDTAFGLTDEVA
jgi:hypothetical protein